jgi:hypothetical protein
MILWTTKTKTAENLQNHEKQSEIPYRFPTEKGAFCTLFQLYIKVSKVSNFQQKKIFIFSFRKKC